MQPQATWQGVAELASHVKGIYCKVWWIEEAHRYFLRYVMQSKKMRVRFCDPASRLATLAHQ
jgi:hypothetical protein